ncbi:peptidoglycan-binding protein [Streptomyces sp. YC504]|uniref:Peptidoglycan-binding protein n=1 Tax=Streptomyces mesophilus TaxID=1775132 RepID=A0A6G4XJ99_9ACTN|nr:peptidoglycan-binding protein [Streptomyces mesophilus]NGO77646.1 peptidoglycan-binding protein [Streptomyces mesophilus]
MRTRKRLRALLAALAVTISGLSTVPLAAAPAAAAANDPCGDTTIRTRSELTLIIIPRIRAGVSLCYVKLGMSGNYVYALQVNILVCYAGTPAATYVKNSGGADGVYGTGTRDAFKWIQRNVWGLTGSDVDGVYGPYARDHMHFALWWHKDTVPSTTTGKCSKYSV